MGRARRNVQIACHREATLPLPRTTPETAARVRLGGVRFAGPRNPRLTGDSCTCQGSLGPTSAGSAWPVGRVGRVRSDRQAPADPRAPRGTRLIRLVRPVSCFPRPGAQESPADRGFLHLPGLARADKCRECLAGGAREAREAYGAGWARGVGRTSARGPPRTQGYAADPPRATRQLLSRGCRSLRLGLNGGHGQRRGHRDLDSGSAACAAATSPSSSEWMSIRQPVRRAARRAFWPSLPIASDSW